MPSKKSTHIQVEKIRFLIISAFLLFITFGVFYFLNKAEEKLKSTTFINSFEQCEKAGYPIMESYPRRCSAGGKTFTETLTEEQINQFSPTPENLIDSCGDGVCQQVACLALGCPKPETKESCPQDCK